MGNRILEVCTSPTRLDPVQSELAVRVRLEKLTSATTIRGRLTGPCCRYSTTIQLTYPLREVHREIGDDGTGWAELRAAIPEACFWDAQSPFVYDGIVELAEAGLDCDRVPIRFAFSSKQLRKTGLFCNGNIRQIRARTALSVEAVELQTLRRAGFNSLMLPVGADSRPAWDLALEYGFYVIGRLEDEASLDHIHSLDPLACTLAWAATSPTVLCSFKHHGRCEKQTSNWPCGLILTERPDPEAPAGADFLIGPEQLLPAAKDFDLPVILQLSSDAAGVPAATMTESVAVAGWVAV